MQGSELKANARRLMLENALRPLTVSILFVIIIAAASDLRFRLPGTENAYTRYMENVLGGTPHSIELFLSYLRPAGAALALILLILCFVMRAGFMSYCLKTTRSQKSGYRNIFDGFLHFRKVLSIIAISTLLIAAWSLLLFIPGIAAFYRYRQAFYILFDDPDKSALDCIRESKLIMRGRKADLFIIDISFICWFALYLLLMIPMLLLLPFSFPVVSIWLAPYMGLSHAAFYDRLLESLAA